MTRNFARLTMLLTIAFAICGSLHANSANAATAVPATVTTIAGYKVSVFAGAPREGKFSKPDSIIQLRDSIFIGYSDAVNGDGTVPGSNPPVQGKNEVIQYDLHGNIKKIFMVTGHNDGLMAYGDYTIWAMSNEDANPILTVIDLQSGKQAEYLPTTPFAHGGLDDMVMIKGVVYASASHHSVGPDGKVTGDPAVVTLALNPNGHTFDWKPILASNAQATHAVTGATVTLNLTQPDSEAVDPDGNLMIDGVADYQLVFIKNPGMPDQSVKILPVTLYRNKWPLDDTRWVPASRKTFMLFADTTTNTIYRVDASFKLGDAYSAGRGSILKLNTTTGILTPVIFAWPSPTECGSSPPDRIPQAPALWRNPCPTAALACVRRAVDNPLVAGANINALLCHRATS